MGHTLFVESYSTAVETINGIGGNTMAEFKPVNADTKSDGVILTVNKDGSEIQISTKLLIGCDGAFMDKKTFQNGQAKELDWFPNRSCRYQYRKRWLEMYSGSEIAPGFCLGNSIRK